MSKELDPRELDFLLRFNIDHSYVSPVDFLSNTAWSAVKVSTNLETHTHTLKEVTIITCNTPEAWTWKSA